MAIFKKTPKILVQVLYMTGKTKWKKYPIDANNKVTIKIGTSGPTGKGITPTLHVDEIFNRGIFNIPYAIYNYGADRFLKRSEADLPPFSVTTVKEYLQTGVFAWIRSAMKKDESIFMYIILFINIVMFVMQLGGFGYINI